MSKPTTEVDLTGFGYERLQHVGKGQYASAALVKEIATGATYVAKCISLAALNDHDQELANQEVILLQTLAHPYIVAYRDSFLIEGSNTLVIVMEFCDGGDLRQVIKAKAKEGEYFPEDQIMSWFVQLCLSLQYCHSEKVLHRDLKTSNIFLKEGIEKTVKLGDFGISRVFEGTTEAAVTIVGTPYYMSPEVCRSEPYNWKSDIWALGCVLYELCMLKHAFESSSLLGLVYKIVSDHYEPIPSCYSPQLNDLIRQLLMKSAESRPTINQLFAIPYVKAYLARLDPMAPALNEHALAHPPRPRIATSLRPKPPPPPGTGIAPPPPPPGPPPIASHSGVFIVASRIRRRLVGQKLNWLSALASFDSEGVGALSFEEMCNALTSMPLGISEAEIAMLTQALLTAPGAKISLDTFSTYLRDVPPEVLQYEAWTRQILAGFGRATRDVLTARDAGHQGTLAPEVFKGALQEIDPKLTDPQLDLLVLLADKNALGGVDYNEFITVFSPPLPAAPVAAVPTRPPQPPAPPGMPPVHLGAPAAGPMSPARPQAPPGMPPIPGMSVPASSAAPAASSQDLGMTLTLGDVNALTFFSCASGVSLLGTSSAPRVTLSNDGCALIFSRIRRRLDGAGVSVADVLALFTNPGDTDFTADQWLEAASSLPLGTSRAEMQQLFSKVDAADSGRVPLAQMASLIGSVSAEHSATPPPWILAAMQRGLVGRIRDELHKLGGVNGATLARESDFKRVVMQTERYLTSDQLSSLLLLADKNSLGLLDYQEFAERFSGVPPVLRVPGGVPPSATAGWSAASTAMPATEEELKAVGCRTVAAMERQGFAPERLPALLALWGCSPPDVVARLLALLPLGLSHNEASSLIQAAGGNIMTLVAQLCELRNQGLWRQWCEWAAGNIPGPALRAVLQRQVIEAECRTLDPAEFIRNLVDSGVQAPSCGPALWLAEKTEQGDICVAEYLTNFGGNATEDLAKKKKKGLRYRFWGR